MACAQHQGLIVECMATLASLQWQPMMTSGLVLSSARESGQ
jgi:hypothetical protein